ncbi:receptor activity-modifying protein 1-like [Anguilla anguilla]|uniref:receptor activity-modifying protein 1-like n=1 Tax=Anguilla anguilla TaxID=7936 RepID=UPI0015A94D9C|nr:receptor activity-modifying protein 1-like [Anguilla anguilla]
MPAYLLHLKTSQCPLHSEESSHYKMTTLLPFVLFPVLLWGGALQINGTKEDDESFQEQEKFLGSHCNENLLELYSTDCRLLFQEDMLDTNKELWCDWQSVIRPYDKLTVCLEYITGKLDCFYPNHIVEKVFLQAHSFYFQYCRDQEDGFNDPPHYVSVSLTLVPVCLIPILVSLVVWKSKVKE